MPIPVALAAEAAAIAAAPKVLGLMGRLLGLGSKAKKGLGAAKAWTQSPGALELMLLGGYGGSQTLNQLGAWGERGVARQGLALQEKLAGAQAGATQRLTTEARAGSEKTTEKLIQMRNEEIQRAREDQLLETFMGGQQQQVAMLLQAAQGMAGTPGASSSAGAVYGGGGIAGILRSRL